MYKRISLTFAALSVAFLTQAQTEVEIKNRQTLFYDECSFGDYGTALPHLDWLISNAPEASENIYKKGATILDKLIKAEEDPGKKAELQEKALNLYRTRFDVFGPNYRVKNTELTKAYQYWNKKPAKYDELLSLFQTTTDLYGPHITSANLLAYMDVVRRVKKHKKTLSDTQVLEEYDKISTLVSQRPDTEDKDEYQERISQILAQTIDLSCDKLDQLLGSKLVDDINAVSSAKLFISLSKKADCQGSENFERALSYVLKYEPTAPIALFKAKTLLKAEQLTEAEQYFGLALTLTEEDVLKSDIYLNLAKIYTLKQNKPKAQDFAHKAIAVNGNKKAYALIGNLYMSSFSECTENKDIVQKRAVFIAAHKMFEKADDQENMALARAQFPSADEIHFNNYVPGQKLEVDCWFKTVVTLDKRN